MFAAVLFDLDDTLISDELVTREAVYVTALESVREPQKAHAIAVSAEKAIRAMWAALPAELHAYVTRIGHGPAEGMWASYDARIPEEAALEEETRRIRPAVWAQALKENGVTHAEPAALAQRWIRVRQQYPLYPDTNEVLARLRPLTKLGVVTNGVSGLQRRKYDGSGLSHWFDALAISGEVRIGKPERGIFDHIARELKVDVAKCVMVGDNPERDVQGGINAGMKTIWIDRGLRPKPSVKADVEVKSLADAWNWIVAQ
ncbi:MAG: HAD family hydrolase [Archangium sp.]|nr:HAD family hydrolase [Archangium sp.]